MTPSRLTVGPPCARPLRAIVGALAWLALAPLPACQDQSSCTGSESLDLAHSALPAVAVCLSADRRSARYLDHYPNGVVQHECTFRGGVADGPYHGWHANGETWLTGAFLNGRPHGKWRLFDDTRRQTAEAYYDEGIIKAGARLAYMAPCPKLTVATFK